MIERNQPISFDFLSMRRDFRNTAKGEQFYLELTASEDDWGELRSFPRDAIGAVVLKWPDVCQSIGVGITGFVRRHKNRDESGEIFFIQLPISQDDWIRLRDYLANGTGIAAATWIRRASEDEMPKTKGKRVAKPKPEKGPYGAIWQRLYAFHNRHDVRHWFDLEIGAEDEQKAIQMLYSMFNVTSRSFISPDELIERLRIGIEMGFNLDGAITAIEDARRRTMKLVQNEREAA